MIMNESDEFVWNFIGLALLAISGYKLGLSGKKDVA